MAKFMVLYVSKVPASERMASASPEDMKASMEEWMSWKDKTSKTVDVDFGMPLQVVNSITAEGVGEGHTPVSGYAILEGDSKGTIIEALRDHPHLKVPGNAIEVLEFLSMPGLDEFIESQSQ
ncbi:MAG: hypothetical protein ACHQT9_03175 [Candidatus Saccharimonadales bacterium]